MNIPCTQVRLLSYGTLVVRRRRDLRDALRRARQEWRRQACGPEARADFLASPQEAEEALPRERGLWGLRRALHALTDRSQAQREHLWDT